jgi:hypothetical protein
MNNTKYRWLFFFFVVLLLLATGETVMAFTISGHLEQAGTSWIPEGAEVQILEVDPVPGGSYEIDQIPLGVDIIDAAGNFSITFTWPLPGPGFDTGDPDIIFRITQMIDSGDEIIYQESPADTRWNVSDGSSYSFALESEYAVFTNPGIDYTSVPADGLFLFTRVGLCETAVIDCIGWDTSSTGYYRARRAPYSFSGDYSDQPFGRTLNLFGWIGSSCNIDYYKVKYSSDGGATWQEVCTYLPNKWYDTSDPYSINWTWVSESMGPVEIGGVKNLYKIPYRERPSTPWSFVDRIARFDSTMAPNGLVHITIEGYKDTGSSIVPATSLDYTIDTNYGDIVLNIDNTPPEVDIYTMTQGSSTINACDIVDLSMGDLKVHFSVTDVRGHLLQYRLRAMFGDNEYVYPEPSGAEKSYADILVGPDWNGSSSYVATYSAGAYTPSQMPSCAYQFRLYATKRTTNGYGLIYRYVEDTKHITIER